MDDVTQLLASALTQGSVYALIALGFSMIYASTGVLNFAQGEFAMLGALCAYVFVADAGLPYAVGAAIAVVVVALIGGFFAQTVIRPLMRRRASIDAMIVATLGVALVLRYGAAVIFGNGEYPIPTPVAGEPVSVAGAAVNPQSFLIIGLGLVVFLVIWAFFARTRPGKMFRAAAADRDAATLVGIEHGRVTLVVVAASAVVTALAGLVYLPLGFGSAYVGLSLGFYGIVAAIAGGLGSPVGAIVGGLAIGAIEALASNQLTGLQDLVIFGVLLLALLLRPNGLVPGRLAVREG